MVTLNLKANTPEEEIVLKHLIPQVNDVLAEKINNGVRIQKDGKTLINKKDLTTFMQYAMEEAKKQIAENQRKGAQAVCVQGDDIMNWAIHFFEEDSIEGKLFNLDGTEYQPPKLAKKKTTPTTATAPITSYTPPAPKPKPQLNIFDMLADSAEPKNETPSNPTAEEAITPVPNKNSEIYSEYCSIQKDYPEFVIAYRLGDFYEIFGEDAVKISDDLDLTLTSKDVGLKERIPIIGFPCRELNSYISRIVSYDHKLAVAESADNIRRFISQNNQTVEIDTGEILSDDIEELSVEEMRQFDGDLNEPEALITVSKLIGETPNEDDTDENDIPDLLDIPAESVDDFDYEKERQAAKAFDVEAMIILQELFDDKITIV